MKKHYVLGCLILVLGTQLASGQILISLLFGDKLNSGNIEFGLDGGLALSNISGIDDTNANSSLHLGFYFDIKTKKENLLIHTGVIVKSLMGAKGIPYYLQNTELDPLFEGTEGTRKLNYFDVPVFLKYRWPNRISVEGGPQIGLLYKAKDEFKTTTDNGQEVSMKNKVKDQYNLFDLGVGVGVGYKLMKEHGINFGVRYYWGLLDIAKHDNPYGSQRNNVFYVYAGIPIGAGKKKSE